MKTIPFFYCFLIVALYALVGCVTNQPLECTASKKSTNKKNLPLSSPAIQIIQTPDRLRILAFSDVCFRSNEKLTLNCARQLSQTIKLIKSYGNGLIQVVGYSDDLYDRKTAAAITQNQAELIVSYLWFHGIGMQRLRAIGYGRHDFIASNRNIKASSSNRRVEIIVVKN